MIDGNGNTSSKPNKKGRLKQLSISSILENCQQSSFVDDQEVSTRRRDGIIDISTKRGKRKRELESSYRSDYYSSEDEQSSSSSSSSSKSYSNDISSLYDNYEPEASYSDSSSGNDSDNNSDDSSRYKRSENNLCNTYNTKSIVNENEYTARIEKIIAERKDTLWQWNKRCQNMNTQEISHGSRWFQSHPTHSNDYNIECRYLIKWSDLSFLHCSWETKLDLLNLVENENVKTYFNTFHRKSHNGYSFDADERKGGEFFDPSYIQIDRILEILIPDNDDIISNQSNIYTRHGVILDKSHPQYDSGTGRQFLIKWGCLPYSESTYEFERDLILMEVDYEDHVRAFLDRQVKPTKFDFQKSESTRERNVRQLCKAFGDEIMANHQKETLIVQYKKQLEEQVYRNRGKLRDYQAEGVAWLISNHVNNRSSILADEMGLGKTLQTVAYIERLASDLKLRGPFLVVAPLSTILHWHREFTGWTSLNTIIYHGNQQDRLLIREYEFAFECDRPSCHINHKQRFLSKVHSRHSFKWMRTWMAQVVITTPEMLVMDDFMELTEIDWELLVVDEAHRLKNITSKLGANLRHSKFVFRHKLLLTGTPIQNNLNELWTLMNTIDPGIFDDMDDFMEKFGNIKSKNHVENLQDIVRPYILRRLKEDVEKSIPPKEETLIEVELTLLQKQYYRALFEKNIEFLYTGTQKSFDGPNINNLAMQLRKCCNSAFLLRGVEEQHVLMHGKSVEEQADILVKASGKLVLLDKLLPRLKEGGHRVLIFSQFTMMLDLLEDYLNLRSFKCERIDGSITGKNRQMAIDRFQAKGSMDSSFIMLLSTRAGGVGINLTAADTCIIFDSDWNPQNDLQAQARCHRIGQTKSVKIYRLLSRKTYEMQMFHLSSLKMGLEQVVLNGIENTSANDSGQGNMTKEEVEKLLRHGAYDIFFEHKAGTSEHESNNFIELDIDSILERRSRTVVHDTVNPPCRNTKNGSAFISKASIKEQKIDEDLDVDDPDFWVKLVGLQRNEVSL